MLGAAPTHPASPMVASASSAAPVCLVLIPKDVLATGLAMTLSLMSRIMQEFGPRTPIAATR
jgi:hypothetical protein